MPAGPARWVLPGVFQTTHTGRGAPGNRQSVQPAGGVSEASERRASEGRRAGREFVRIGAKPTSEVGFAPRGLPPRGRWTSRSIRRVLSRPLPPKRPRPVTVIHLGRPLLTGSSALPADSGGPPSNACCLSLLQVGFTEPTGSPRPLVVSYTTVSPLPRVPADRHTGAVCFLWHCPADRSGWLLATTLPWGARTFLGTRLAPGDATV